VDDTEDMKKATFSYRVNHGWSVSEFPRLDSDQTLVLVFAAPEFRDKPEVIAELIAAYPHSHFIGCTTSGEIHNDQLHDHSLSVAVVQFESTTLITAAESLSNTEDTFPTCERIATKLNKPGIAAAFVLSDGLIVNGSELGRAFNSILDSNVIITGGLAGDGPNFNQTHVLHNGELKRNVITAIGFYGDKLSVQHAFKGGWDKFGHERIVTRSKGNILYELDGKPALEIYKKYLGDRENELPASALLFPLSVQYDNNKNLVRTVLAVDEEKQSMTFAGDIPQGAKTQFLYANFDRIIEGAAKAGELATGPSDENTLIVSVSCVGRRLVLGDRTEEELEAILDAFPPGTPMVGYYSYGELSPDEHGNCDLHNQSMTLTTFNEAA
jgi:hypothetical protein